MGNIEELSDDLSRLCGYWRMTFDGRFYIIELDDYITNPKCTLELALKDAIKFEREKL